jgi:hypothetical protein
VEILRWTFWILCQLRDLILALRWSPSRPRIARKPTCY